MLLIEAYEELKPKKRTNSIGGNINVKDISIEQMDGKKKERTLLIVMVIRFDGKQNYT